MRVLLDTHLLLWALADPERLPADARQQIDDGDVFVSAASLWELAIKFAIGKLETHPAVVMDAVGPAGFALLPIQAPHAVRVAELPEVHKDPFDRMLVAQALVESMTLLTNDGILRDYGPVVLVV